MGVDNVISKWIKEIRFENTVNWELILIKPLKPPKLEIKKLILASKAKYIEVNLYSRLNWKRNVDKRQKIQTL